MSAKVKSEDSHEKFTNENWELAGNINILYYSRHMGIGMENVCCLIRILMFDMCNTAPSAELLSVELWIV